MKTFAIVLLVAALCVERVASLDCYHCDRVKSHGDCKMVKCSHMDKYCVTREQRETPDVVLYSKWCAASCLNSVETKGGKTTGDVCCDYDGCNSGGPISVKTSYIVMALAGLVSLSYILWSGL
ncbi:lymphocyte antigen 6E-like [Hemicordylus capensis]|uniref:lymphocyte antigen 6E-like n=1 Tax=Hemicordylus capensis TaxID=884348 RepID=UPI0023040B68|nr:lymphocyte antigen 6E-like [Hemicordylus capensis]